MLNSAFASQTHVPLPPAYRVRPALPEDHEFLTELYASTRADELDQAGFPNEQRAAFCRMQFSFQQRHYQQHFAHAEVSIFELADQAIGRELIARTADQLTLVDIALLPAYRNQGIGSDRLRLLIAQSAVLACPIRLHVLQGSAAQALYARHGFVVVQAEGAHWLMERSAR